MAQKWARTLRAAAAAGLLLSQSISLMAGSTAGSILGCARPYAILGASGVSNSGWSAVYGDLGAESVAGITGFPPGVVFEGSIHPGDPDVLDALIAASTAYQRLTRLPPVPITAGTEGNLGGLKLSPGVYAVDKSARLNGTLRLDVRGQDHAVFVFQIGSSLTTTRNAAVVVLHGGHGEEVYWQVGDSVKLGEGTSFEGNILAHNNIVMGANAKIRCGRAFALTGEVVMDANSVSTACESAEQPLPGLVTGFLGTDSNFGPAGTVPFRVSASPEPGTFWLAASCLAGWIAIRFLHHHHYF